MSVRCTCILNMLNQFHKWNYAWVFWAFCHFYVSVLIFEGWNYIFLKLDIVKIFLKRGGGDLYSIFSLDYIAIFYKRRNIWRYLTTSFSYLMGYRNYRRLFVYLLNPKDCFDWNWFEITPSKKTSQRRMLQYSKFAPVWRFMNSCF